MLAADPALTLAHSSLSQCFISLISREVYNHELSKTFEKNDRKVID